MNVSSIYAIAAGGCFLALFLIQTRTTMVGWIESCSVLISRHVTLPTLIHRHRVWGPWSRLNFLIYLIYIIVNIIIVFFYTHSVAQAGRRARELALINLTFPLSATHLGCLADLLGITWRTYCKIHQATGWMSVALLSFHVVAGCQSRGFSFPLRPTRNIFTLIGSISLAALALLSLPWLRRRCYKVFLRSHQALTALFLYSAWRYLPDQSRLSKLYLYVPLVILALTTLLEIINLCYTNRLFSGHGPPRAFISFTPEGSLTHPKLNKAAQVRLVLPRSIEIDTGQYINLWMPSVGSWPWLQTHPFILRGRHDTIELFVQPRGGITSDLLSLATGAPGCSVPFLAMFTDPHGTSEIVDRFKTVLLVASGFGIATTIPYLKKMIHGYNTCTLHIRRLHFSASTNTNKSEMVSAAEYLLNPLLEDDIIDKGYISHQLQNRNFILSISIYVEKGLAHNKTPIGKYERACFYQGAPNNNNIVSLEASGDQIKRLPSIRDKQGRTLVMAAGSLRDQIRKTVKGFLHRGIRLRSWNTSRSN
ncbi:hypothetical protein N7481_002918 [Penicillium waksmanii]|uniref:uncharacterized protein n=1 Tax=Penicillium waksmanii TaxID=69791 RepID=UPI002549575F|nr:uncharacterized protein N7481_002918 [Penicillium waksmanii]KAJ5987708.1 hypothetical protein N7481_002918 [Penicillium waksmanii]